MLEPSKKKTNSKMRNPKRIPWGRFFFWLFFLSFIAAVVYALFFAGLLSIKDISVEGTANMDSNLLAENVRREFSGKYFGYIPKDNMIFAFPGRIENSFKGRYKLIESVRMERKFPDTLRIWITERQMKLILCSSGECYYADKNGNLFLKDDFSADEIKEDDFPVLNDSSNVQIDVSNDVIDPSYIGFISSVRDSLASRLGLGLDRNMETPSRVSSDLRITTDEGWRIFFNREIDAEKEVSMLELVLKDKIGQDSRANLEYVDLRADNKVFYKFKDQSSQEASQDGQQDSSVSSSSSSAPSSDSKDKKDDKKKKK